MFRLALVTSLVCIASTATARADVEATALQRWVTAYLRNEYRDDARRRSLTYDYRAIDLNGDGRSEILLYVAGGSCGTGGCGLTILHYSGSRWRVISATSIGWSPIRILRNSSRGWRDLGVLVAGGGVTKPYVARLRFNGKTYPINPSVPPATRVTAGTSSTVAIETATRRLF